MADEVTTDYRDPTIDELMVILKWEMRVGIGAMPVMKEAYTQIDTYREFFEERLRRGLWQNEGTAVRNAARQLGVISASLASLHHSEVVNLAIVQIAAQVVEANCNIGGQGGRWCGRDSMQR